MNSIDALKHFVIDSNEALELKLVRDVTDIEDEDCAFSPEMTHQVFGESEKIFGYVNLKIKLYYSAGSLQTFLGVKYSEKLSPAQHGVAIEAQDVIGMLAEKLQPGFLTNQDDFAAAVSKDEHFIPVGMLIHSFSVDCDGKARTFEVYLSDSTTPGFLSFHERLQPFLLWFVDAASFIDVDDDQWRFFVLYEKYKNSTGKTLYATVGYSTVYQYYAYPNHIRPRISQMLILPPFQRLGLGAELLQAIYIHYIQLSNVVDITVEDPSDDFQRLRDFLDAKHCSTLPSFSQQNLQAGYNKSMAEEAKNKFRINGRQARRVYEILRLRATDTENAVQYKNYRLNVKKRLNIPYQKQQNDVKKLQNCLSRDEYLATISFIGLPERQKRLDNEYQELEEKYKHVIDRLNSE